MKELNNTLGQTIIAHNKQGSKLIAVKCTQADLEEYQEVISNKSVFSFSSAPAHTKSFTSYVTNQIQNNHQLVNTLRDADKVNVMNATFAPDFSFQTLSDLNLNNLNLSGIYGINTTFQNCTLENTNLTDSVLLLAKFEQCSFKGTDFTGSYIELANGTLNTGTLNYLGEIPSNTDITSVTVTHNDLQKTYVEKIKEVTADVSTAAQGNIGHVANKGLELVESIANTTASSITDVANAAKGGVTGYYTGLAVAGVIGATFAMPAPVFAVVTQACSGLGALEGANYKLGSSDSLIRSLFTKKQTTADTQEESKTEAEQSSFTQEQLVGLEYFKLLKIDLQKMEIERVQTRVQEDEFQDASSDFDYSDEGGNGSLVESTNNNNDGGDSC